MNLEDESLLSAYLDGELAPAEHRAVESALRSDPALAERLRQLSRVRDLVADLPRPVLADSLAATIVARITPPAASPRRPIVHRLRPRVRTLAGLAAAASVVLSLSLGLRLTLQNVPPRPDLVPLAAKKATTRVVAAQVRPAARHLGVEAAGRVRRIQAGAASAATTTALSPIAAADGDGGRTEVEDQRQIRALLDSPRLKHVLLVTDKLGGGAVDRVDRLVQGSPRLDSAYGRMTVAPEIIIDPDHPGAATVFVLVMDDRELGQLRSKLAQAFPDSLEESAPDPAVITQLADIGQVAVLPGTSMAALVPPPANQPERVAIRSEPRRDRVQEKPVIPDEFDNMQVTVVGESNREGPTPQQMRSGPHPSTLALKDPESAPAADEREGPPRGAAPADLPRRPTSIVLVWVATRGPGIGGR